MKTISWREASLAAVAAVLLSGCALAIIGGGAAIATGVVAYRNGDLQVMDDVPFPNAWRASQAAVKDLEYITISEKKDALEGELIARTADSTKVTITFKKMNDKTTKITIRVGTFGEEEHSRLVLDKIRARY